ncbi:MAG: glycosyltransferase family 4 protein [Chloroflexi bacterium]|nr:glycosyltransferase family 4 protein [Chloroflexota bacterium]
MAGEPLPIFIDATAALKQHAGIGRYTRGLIDALAKNPPDIPIHLVVPRDAPAPPPHWPFPVRRLFLSEREAIILWQRLRVPFPMDFLIGRGRLFHSPDFVLPALRRTPGIVTVHDLSFLVYPQYAVPGLEFYLRGAVPRSVRRAHLVLADSESTRRDLIRFWDTPPEKVRVLYPGISPRFRPVEDPEVLEHVRRQYRLPSRFILSVSRLEPRKNFPGLIAAFNRFKAQTHQPHHLVIAGGKGWLYGPIFRAAEQSPYREEIHFPGFVADEHLPALYSLADVFAYPSFYEGFGFPPLEAMACGTPVISADNSSLPEVVGDAGILLPAEDVEGWAQALARLLSDATLRERLREKGYAQAAKFSWDASARGLVQIYRALG